MKLLRVASGAMSSLARIADCLDNPELMESLQKRLTQQGAEPEDLVTVSLGDRLPLTCDCLLYTSDAADDLPCVDLGGRRIIKKKKKKKQQ